MPDRFQFSRMGDKVEWTPGKEIFDKMMDNAVDEMKFHKGEGWRIKVGDEEPGPVRKLHDVPKRLRAILLTENPRDTIVRVISVEDDWRMLFRRHQVAEDRGQIAIAQAASLQGTRYLFGVTDCSWLSGECVEAATNIVLPHNAHAQRLDDRVVPINRSQVKPGDLVFIHNDAHVAIWLDANLGGRVWDTEPSDTGAPQGWPTPRLGTGVQIRPAFGNYYCADINAFGRIVAMNGAP